MNKPNIFLRFTMQLLSFLLSLMLGVSIVAAVLIADLHTLTSSGGSWYYNAGEMMMVVG